MSLGWRLPRALAADLRALRRRFPKEAGTFQAGLLEALIEGWLADREAVLSPTDAWAAAGYEAQYPEAPPDPSLVEESRRNLAKSLRGLAADDLLKYLWVVEKARGEGYRLRVVDERRGLALARGWTFAPFDREIWESRRVVSIMAGPGHTLGVGLPAWGIALLSALALLAGWLWLRPLEDTGDRVRVAAGTPVAAATCSSSLWQRGGGRPDHEWTRCAHAVDGWIGGREAWVGYAEGDPADYAEWIELELAADTEVWVVAVHFPHWPCTRPGDEDVVCQAVGRPHRLEAWGRGPDGEWHLLASPSALPATAPWEPAVISLGGARASALRIVGRQSPADGDLGLFVYFQVAEIVVNPPDPVGRTPG